MKKTIISLFLTIAIICSIFVNVFATDSTNPHSIIGDPETIIVTCEDTDPH